MDLLSTIIIVAIVSLISVKLGHKFGKSNRKNIPQLLPPAKTITDDGSIPWYWVDISKGSKTSGSSGFRCPKCQWLDDIISPNGINTSKKSKAHTKSVVHPQLCECSEYHESHFHYECTTCKFKAIMRTADRSL